jgi:hypothetical protein
LSPDGDEPSDEVWVPYTYRDVHRVLTRTRDNYRNAIGDQVLVFLDHYLNLLGTRFMDDEKLDDLCRRIYKNHRQAIDLIWERVGGPAAAGLSEVITLLDGDDRWHTFYRSGKYVEFVPKAWVDWLPPLGTFDEPRHWVCVYLKLSEQRISWTVFIGPMTDAAKRTKIIARLREAGPEVGLKRSKTSKVGDRWDRVTGAESILEWGEDDEPGQDAIRNSVKEALDGLYPKLDKLAAVLKPLCIS